MNIKETIINIFPSAQKIENKLDCYLLNSRRYLIFWNDPISKDSVDLVLTSLESKTNDLMSTKMKTLIVVGKTIDRFKKKELFFFNGVDTFVVFYLINELKNEVYMNDSWIFTMGLNYRRYVKKIHAAITHEQLP